MIFPISKDFWPNTRFEKLVIGEKYCIQLEKTFADEKKPLYGTYFGIKNVRKERAHIFFSLFKSTGENEGHLSVYTAPIYHGPEGHGLCQGKLETILGSTEEVLVLQTECRWKYEKNINSGEREYILNRMNENKLTK